ncbi:DUF268 domain-containing protein [Clostridium oryzae]|uniref:DUF268 domain-containing protein n=1 Tax=Clostridium oryzae TaxID=1450648 RepID=A0A1V4IM27_9CLOT|nr:DUF268 domain-containing protein [Clostridium oryzae]OPJ60894.1 hypothetical protein CLORY_26010 [Clostridium oryzae]
MNKKKVVIFGLGSLYKKFEKDIEKKYDIVGRADNNSAKSLEYSNFIEVNNIVNLDFDFILIVSSFYHEIKSQLMYTLSIEENRILQYKFDERRLSIREIRENIGTYEKMNKRDDFKIDKKNLYIFTNDISESAGYIDGHYFYQDIWAAQKILKNNPLEHYDVGSRIDGLISHLLVFRNKVNLIDIRPLNYNIDGIQFICADATNMNGIADDSIESLSSLHVIEHFGLGRYGDEIDPDACFKAIKAFQRVVKSKGKLYISVPIGKENKVCFNAHRIFNPLTFISEFTCMELLEFSYISEGKIKKVLKDEISNEINNISDYSCGLFEFIKI